MDAKQGSMSILQGSLDGYTPEDVQGYHKYFDTTHEHWKSIKSRKDKRIFLLRCYIV